MEKTIETRMNKYLNKRRHEVLVITVFFSCTGSGSLGVQGP